MTLRVWTLMMTAVVVGGMLAGPSAAEVRLRTPGGTATVDVVPTSRGPWTPRGPVNGQVLNPAGDVMGDGFPDWSSSGQRVLTSWVGSNGSLVAAVGKGVWSAPIVIEAPDAVGSPVVTGLDGGWAIAWQDGHGDPAVRLVAVSATGDLGVPLELSSGWLVDVAPVGASSVSVATVTPLGEISITTIVFGNTPAPDPILIPSVRGPITVETLGFSPLLSSPADWLLLPNASGGLTPDIRLHSGDRHGEPYALATWWVSSNELHWIELTEDGPEFPVEVLRAPGNAAYSQSLVQRAVNDVRAR